MVGCFCLVSVVYTRMSLSHFLLFFPRYDHQATDVSYCDHYISSKKSKKCRARRSQNECRTHTGNSNLHQPIGALFGFVRQQYRIATLVLLFFILYFCFIYARRITALWLLEGQISCLYDGYEVAALRQRKSMRTTVRWQLLTLDFLSYFFTTMH